MSSYFEKSDTMQPLKDAAKGLACETIVSVSSTFLVHSYFNNKVQVIKDLIFLIERDGGEVQNKDNWLKEAEEVFKDES